MKKIAVIILSLALVFTLSSCGKTTSKITNRIDVIEYQENVVEVKNTKEAITADEFYDICEIWELDPIRDTSPKAARATDGVYVSNEVYNIVFYVYPDASYAKSPVGGKQTSWELAYGKTYEYYEGDNWSCFYGDREDSFSYAMQIDNTVLIVYTYSYSKDSPLYEYISDKENHEALAAFIHYSGYWYE